jgi:outer membrane protein insertion porin family
MKTIIFYSIILLLISFGNLLPEPIGDQNTTQKGLIVESIEISGNKRTPEDVILANIDFEVGDRINQKQLDNNFRHLEQTNLFRDVDFYTQPGESHGQIRVYIEVKERRWPYFQFKSGYSELDGWYISPLGLRFDNIFGGGNYMGAEMLIGDRVTGLDLFFLRPNFANSGLNFRALIFSRNRQFVHYLDEDKFLQEVAGAGLSFRLNGNRGLMKYLWLEFISETFKPKDYMYPSGHKDDKRTLPAILQFPTEKQKVNHLILSLNADTRNRKFYPTRGWWGSLSYDLISEQFGADDDFTKIILDVRRYQKLAGKTVLAFRAKGAWISDTAPFYEKFYLGGPNSLRGFDDRSLNPLGYASRLVQGSAELRFPVTPRNYPRHFITAVVFYDIGQAWSEPNDFDKDNFKSGIGYGFRIKLPIVGLLRTDFAYGLPDYDFRFHVSLGHTF